jgi:hypothetical protein
MEPGVSADSLQVLVKQVDLDKGRRNDGLTSEELRQPRRRVRCPLPCVASAAISYVSVLPDSGVRFPRAGQRCRWMRRSAAHGGVRGVLTDC